VAAKERARHVIRRAVAIDVVVGRAVSITHRIEHGSAAGIAVGREHVAKVLLVGAREQLLDVDVGERGRELELGGVCLDVLVERAVE